MRVSGTQEDRKYSPVSMVCRFHGKKCLEVSKETWEEPGKVITSKRGKGGPGARAGDKKEQGVQVVHLPAGL